MSAKAGSSGMMSRSWGGANSHAAIRDGQWHGFTGHNPVRPRSGAMLASNSFATSRTFNHTNLASMNAAWHGNGWHGGAWHGGAWHGGYWGYPSWGWGGWGCCGWGFSIGVGWGLTPFWGWPPYWYNPYLYYDYPAYVYPDAW